MKKLQSHHLSMLEDGSGLPKALITQRGYFTATDPDELLKFGFSAEQAAQVPALVIPIWGVDGTIVNYQSRPDNPRHNDEGKPVKYETPAGSIMRLDVHPNTREMISDPSAPLWITEGVKKGDSGAARGLCIISLLGVWNWRGTNEKAGSVELADWDRIAIKGRRIFIVFDSDVMVKPEVAKALKRLAGLLKRRGAKEIIPIVPPSSGDKVGLDDYFVSGGNIRALERSSRLDLLETPGIIINGRSLASITEDALNALVEDNIPPKIFVRGGEIARVVIDERDMPKIQGVNVASLRGLLARCASWVKTTKDGTTEVLPPKDIAEDIIALGKWPFPPVIAVTKAPVLSDSGTIAMTPGYDPASSYYINADQVFPEWEGDCQSAVDYILRDVLSDFPFAGEADQLGALALMLLPIVRPAIKGPTPLHLIDAPVQGSGKTLLAKVCLAPTAGSDISVTTGSRNEDEWRKKITSSLLEGRPYIFFDNLTRKIDSESFASTLTSNVWNDRELNFTRNVDVPIRCVWVATGNNAELSRDIVRRSLWIRIDARVENPEDRKDFKHPEIEEFIKKNRPKIVAALCHIVMDWLRNNKPMYSGDLVGSYEEYCKVMGGILENAGLKGFWSNRALLKDTADSEGASWKAFVKRWWTAFNRQAMSPKELIETFSADDELAVTLGDKGETQRAANLGRALKRRSGVVLAGFRITRTEDSHTKSARYVIRPFGEETPAENQETPAEFAGVLRGIEDKNLLDFESDNQTMRGIAGDSRVYTRARDTHDSRKGSSETTPKPPQPPQSDDEEDVVL